MRKTLAAVVILFLVNNGCATVTSTDTLTQRAIGTPGDTATEEIVKKLVAGSLWEGEFGYGYTPASRGEGTVVVSFAVSDGSLRGELISITGWTADYPGPLGRIQVKDNLVSFISPNGVYIVLHFDDGKLVGEWIGRSRARGWLSLSPTKK